jgi:hypothetical protein
VETDELAIYGWINPAKPPERVKAERYRMVMMLVVRYGVHHYLDDVWQEWQLAVFKRTRMLELLPVEQREVYTFGIARNLCRNPPLKDPPISIPLLDSLKAPEGEAGIHEGELEKKRLDHPADSLRRFSDFDCARGKYYDKPICTAGRALRLGRRRASPRRMSGSTSAVPGMRFATVWALAGRRERTGRMPGFITNDERRLRSYLLKLATDEELDQIEEVYLSTSEHAELIDDVENRLISDYVQGRLSEEEERAFTINYLVTPERREQVAIARALVDLPISALSPAPSSLWRRIVAWMSVPTPALVFAPAGAAVLLAVTSFVMFLGWRGQIRQTQVATRQAQELRGARAKAEERVLTASVLSVPVLRADEANLAAGRTQKLTFRLPADLPDAIVIPIDLPQITGGAVVDAVLSASGQTVWVERAVRLLASGRGQYTELRVPFATLQPHLGRPFRLEIVERDHASLAVFQMLFETERASK